MGVCVRTHVFYLCCAQHLQYLISLFHNTWSKLVVITNYNRLVFIRKASLHTICITFFFFFFFLLKKKQTSRLRHCVAYADANTNPKLHKMS